MNYYVIDDLNEGIQQLELIPASDAKGHLAYYINSSAKTFDTEYYTVSDVFAPYDEALKIYVHRLDTKIAHHEASAIKFKNLLAALDNHFESY